MWLLCDRFKQTILLFVLTACAAMAVACTGAGPADPGGTGFFRVEQADGRWRFVDPRGTPFFSTGMCSVSAKGNYAPALGYSPYHENIMALYGSEEVWAEKARDRMDAWGFNTIASGDEHIKATGLPYTLNLGMAGANGQIGEIPDYFCDEWKERIDRIGRETVAPVKDDHDLLGFFLDNELHWGPDWRKLSDLFAEYGALPFDSPGKRALVEFLQERYESDIRTFNRAWRTCFDSFDEILYVSSLGLKPCSARARDDRAAFTYVVADRYFRLCHEAVRRYDEHHLILGARFQSWLTPHAVVEACAPYVDVVSANQYYARPLLLPAVYAMEALLGFVTPTNALRRFHEITGRPILISEFHFRARDSGLPNQKPPPLLFPVLPTQKGRANCFEAATRWFIEKPYSVGYHWFAYSDQPETGRFDGENSNIGVVNEMDEPYELLVERMTEINRLAQSEVIQR